MLVNIILSIFFIYTVRTEDNVSSHEVLQLPSEAPTNMTLSTDESVLNQSSTDARKRFNIYYDQASKPLVIDSPEILIHSPMVCKNSGILLKILDALLSFVNPDNANHMPTESVSDITELIKDYSKYAPNDQQHNELYFKLKSLVRDINGKASGNPVNDYKYPLRNADYDNEPDSKVKTKIVFQYKLPSLNHPNCKNVFLKLNQAAHDAYLQLAKYPMCQNPNNNVNIPYMDYDNFGSEVVPQNPYYVDNKDDNYVNPIFFSNNEDRNNYRNPNRIFVPTDESNNHDANPNRIFVPTNGDRNNYINSNPTYLPNDGFPNRINPFEPSHPNEENDRLVYYLKKFFQQPLGKNDVHLNHIFPPYNINSNKYYPFKPEHSNSVNQDFLYYIRKLLQNPNNKLKDIMSKIQTIKTSHLKNEPHDLIMPNLMTENPSPFVYYPDSNDKNLPTYPSNPIISILNGIYEPKPNNILTKVTEILPYQTKDKPVDEQDVLPYNQNVPYHAQIPTQNLYNPNEKPYPQGAFTIQVENPYQSRGVPNQPDDPQVIQVPVQSPNNLNQKPFHHDRFTIKEENQNPTQSFPYKLNYVPEYYQKEPVQKLSMKHNGVSQNPNNIRNYITHLNSSINYVQQLNDGHKIPNLSSLLTVPNLLKLDTLPNKEGVIELTYLLKRPNPLVYRPFYYVKYRLPFATFLYNMKVLLHRNPQLRLNPEKLYQELIVLSNVSETSTDLKGFKKDFILKLTFSNGALVAAKMINDKVTSFDEQLKVISDLTADEILNLGNLVDNNVPSNLNNNMVNKSKRNFLRTYEGMNPGPTGVNTIPLTIYSQQPFIYNSVYDVKNPMVPSNLGLPVFNAQSLKSFNVISNPIKPIELSVSHPGVKSVNFISDLVKSINLGSSDITQGRSYTISRSQGVPLVSASNEASYGLPIYKLM